MQHTTNIQWALMSAGPALLASLLWLSWSVWILSHCHYPSLLLSDVRGRMKQEVKKFPWAEGGKQTPKHKEFTSSGCTALCLRWFRFGKSDDDIGEKGLYISLATGEGLRCERLLPCAQRTGQKEALASLHTRPVKWNFLILSLHWVNMTSVTKRCVLLPPPHAHTKKKHTHAPFPFAELNSWLTT